MCWAMYIRGPVIMCLMTLLKNMCDHACVDKSVCFPHNSVSAYGTFSSGSGIINAYYYLLLLLLFYYDITSRMASESGLGRVYRRTFWRHKECHKKLPGHAPGTAWGGAVW